MFNWLIVIQSPKNIPLIQWTLRTNSTMQLSPKKNRGTQWPQEPPVLLSLLSSCCWSQSLGLRFCHKKNTGSHTWRIIPVIRKWWKYHHLYAIKKPFGRGTTRSLGDLITMVINHLLTGMILQLLSMKDSLGFHKDPFLTSWFMK